MTQSSLLDSRKEPSFWLISGLLFVVGFIASYLGMMSFKVELESFSDNPIIANMMFITFIIIIVERVLESYNSSLRKPLRLECISELEKIQKEIEDKRQMLLCNNDIQPATDQLVIPEELVLLQKKLVELQANLVAFKHQTRRQLLIISVLIGGFLSAMGCLNFLSPFIDDTLFVGGENEGIHRAIFDGMTVVISGWLVAGGSEGWNSVTSWMENAVNPKKS